MDVHAPHEPIHGIKDFLLHLLTITVGLLIAVGIEGLVERHREHVLVKEARATLREEITYNAGQMKSAMYGVAEQKAAIAKDISNLQRILANPKDQEAQNAGMVANFSLRSSRDTAFKTAQETGALSYMPYKEAEAYAELYGMQTDFETRQDKLLEDESKILGTAAMTPNGVTNVSADQARQALETFGEWQAHLGFLELAAKISYASEEAFLAGKEGPKSMNISFDNPK